MGSPSRDLPPLHQAAIVNDAVAAARLIEAGADTAERFGEADSTPLHVAAEHQAAEVARLLLDAGVPVDALDGWGNTPLQRAVVSASGEGAMIMLLRARGADPYQANSHGQSPLEFARLLGEYEAARFFSDLADPWGPGGPYNLYLLTEPSTIPERIDRANEVLSKKYPLLVSYGFAPATRDFDVVFELIVNDDFTDGRFRYPFTNCAEVTASSLLSDGTWGEPQSDPKQEDVFTDLAAYQSGGPSRLWWDHRSLRRPMRYLDGSERAAEWSARLGHSVHHVEIATNEHPEAVYRLDVICEDLRITRLADGPYLGELHHLDDAAALVCERCDGGRVDPHAHRYTPDGTRESLPCICCGGSGENRS